MSQKQNQIQLRHLQPSSGPNEPSGGNREWSSRNIITVA